MNQDSSKGVSCLLSDIARRQEFFLVQTQHNVAAAQFLTSEENVEKICTTWKKINKSFEMFEMKRLLSACYSWPKLAKSANI